MTALGARIRWTAGPDGTAHAHRVGQGIAAIRTPCGLKPIDERFAHPERRRCEECRRALEEAR